MIQDHESIKERLPEYLFETLSDKEKDEIPCHLEGCRECREELTLLTEIRGLDVPDPGELFWSTLPQKIRTHAKDGQKSRFIPAGLFSPLSLAALLLLIAIVLGPLAYNNFSVDYYYDPLFTDPFEESSLDYASIDEEALISFSEGLIVNGDTIDQYLSSYDTDSYHKELSSLSTEELDSIYKALEALNKNGGVI
jgi:hypothetical protein